MKSGDGSSGHVFHGQEDGRPAGSVDPGAEVVSVTTSTGSFADKPTKTSNRGSSSPSLPKPTFALRNGACVCDEANERMPHRSRTCARFLMTSCDYLPVLTGIHPLNHPRELLRVCFDLDRDA